MQRFLLLIISVLSILCADAQVVINEGSYRNFTQVTDTAGNSPDWIELYNAGNNPVSLWHYHLSDNPDNLLKWTMPEIRLSPKQWLIIFASGKGSSNSNINHWETAVMEDDLWKWVNPTEKTPTSWMKPGFDDSSWNSGRGGFGYGDGDDRTEFPMDKVSVYTRISFEVSDLSKIVAATLHVDYDDGFVAYLNGNEIARVNMSKLLWNSTADVSREALMFQGKKPEGFDLDLNTLTNLLHVGNNVLAVECHNFTNGQIDMSLRTFLSFGLSDAGTQFGPLPAWFINEYDRDLHTNFKISSTGETIYLTDNNGVMIDQLVLPPDLPVNSSMGSETDGSLTKAVFLTGTPKASNETQIAYVEGFEVAPSLSTPGGFYQNAVEVLLSSPSPTARIRYTTNSQIPTDTSALYTGVPISVPANMVLKARSFSSGHKLPSPVITGSYFIRQSPTPAGILSITMQTGDLYGDTGIYDNWWTDWKKQCYIEYFEPSTHRSLFKQSAGIRIDGGAGGSRSQPQHSFRIEPGNGALGDGNINYPLIPSRPDRNSYATFYLRNGSNQYLYYPCKDAIETRCMGEGTKNSFSGYTPVQVYLNGYYWGYYELREKIDEDYFKQHFGTDEDSINILSVSYWYGGALRAVAGHDPVTHFNDDYNKFLSLNAFGDSFWQMADRYFDLEYYTDYICAQSYMADTDWPYNNIKIHSSPQTGNRWRFSLTDLEWSLAPNGWTDSNMDHIRFMLDYDQNYPYIHIWQKAMQNHTYRDYFINRYADLLNTSWQKDRISGIANEVYNATRPEMPATYKRWGDPNIPVNDYMAQFTQAHQIMLSEFANRPANVRNHLRTNLNLPKAVSVTLNVEPAGSGTIRISTVKPDVYPWVGTYFDGVPIKIEALPNPGFSFTNWDANNLIKNVINPVFLDTLKRVSSIFKAHFKAETFSEKLVVSEINYNSELSVDAGDWIEIWNFDQSLTASLNGWYFTDEDTTHVFRFPDNTTLRPDERLVIVSDPVKFKTQHPGIPFIGSFTFGLGGNGDAIRLFNYTRKLVFAVAYDDATPWPLGADGQGRTLELKSELHPASNPENWFDGCIGGSPGAPWTHCGEQIVFSEINYQSDSGLDTGDWVELRNIGESVQDISGWIFKDETDRTGHSYTIPNGTMLAPHGNRVLAQDTAKFRDWNPGFSDLLGPFLFGLKDKGEWIRAYDASGVLRLSVRYNNTEPWPTLAGGMGYTLELVDSLDVMNDGSNWMTGCIGGSPGRYYSVDCSGSGILENHQTDDVSVYPNPAIDIITVTSTGSEPVRVILKNQYGETVLFSDNPAAISEISIKHLPAGSYILIVQLLDGKERIMKVVKI